MAEYCPYKHNIFRSTFVGWNLGISGIGSKRNLLIGGVTKKALSPELIRFPNQF